MKTKNHRRPALFPVAFFVLLSLLALAHSCAVAPTLRTTAAYDSEITGTYTLILFGGNYTEDLHTIAFLDREGDQFTLAPYAPDWQYRMKKGVSARDAIGKAEQFVSTSPSFRNIQLSKILDAGGNAIGYEVRPLYISTTYGSSDVLDVWYTPKNTTVNIHIHIKDYIERRLHGGNGVGGRGK